MNFNLSWNGFGLEGSLALENVFKENMSLKCIDLSNNRINWDGMVYLARGLRKNNMLRILKVFIRISWYTKQSYHTNTLWIYTVDMEALSIKKIDEDVNMTYL